MKEMNSVFIADLLRYYNLRLNEIPTLLRDARASL
jgi:hypothetical protein